MKTRIALGIGIAALVSAVFLFLGTGMSQEAGTAAVKEYTIVVEEKQIEYAPGQFFTAWTYNGSIPGPVIRANVGDTVKITLINRHNLKHSIHVHGFEYNDTDDGSNMSTPSVVAAGGTYTYTFRATRPGFYPYHCHSNDKYGVSVHIQQGLQGGIIVEDPANPLPPAKEYMVILNEVYPRTSLSIGHGCSYCAGSAKYFALNSRQMGLPQALNVTSGVIENPTARAGELVRFYVVNLGNDIHTFHLHGHELYKRSASNWGTTQLVDGDNIGILTAETAVLETYAKLGTWLYHCHMDVHADLGMMGKFYVTP